MEQTREGIVIGAGLAGLAAADELRRAGVDVRVFEASDRIGGRVWSVPFAESVTVERGAEFVLPGAEALYELAERYGLELAAKGMAYGDREPRGAGPVTSAQLQAGVELVREKGWTSGTVAEALDALPLEPAVAAALRARVEISCTHRADDLGVAELTAATSHIGDFDTHTVVGGNARFAEALASTLHHSVHLNTPVRRLVWTADGVHLNTPTGEASADAAVVAIPARVMNMITFEPSLPEEKEPTQLRYGHAAKLFVRLEETVAPSATMSVPGRFWCYTQLGPNGERLPVLGSLASTEEASAQLHIDDGPDRWLAALAELRPELKLDRSTVLLSSWHDAPHAGAVQVARSFTHPMDDDVLARPVSPLFFAGEHTAGPVWHGTMEGAVRSGQRAAAEILGSSGR